MAKKKKATRATASPTAFTEVEGQPLGTVVVQVQTVIYPGEGVVSFNEIVIEWACLGLSVEPDSVTEVSGNNVLLDPAFPPITSAEGLHVFLKNPLPHGSYGFLFNFTYADSAICRTADPEARKALYEPPAPPVE